MRHLPTYFLPVLVVGVAALLFVVAGLTGGADYSRDVSTIYSLAAERGADPLLTTRAIVLTNLGGALGMIPILTVAAALLVFARRWRDAAWLVGIVIGGRLAIELLKIVINRPRPSLSAYPVEVTSLGFPSGHAGNSMITFLAIALIVVPARWRGVAAVGGILLSFAIGATRPILGVHWPSDVVGGWAFGIAWVVALVTLSRRRRGAAE